MIKKEANVKGLGTIYYVSAPFDKALNALKNYDIISARDLAYARIQKGEQHSVSDNGSYIKEGSLFVPKDKNKRYWLRKSLILDNAKSAVNAHREGKEYFLDNNFTIEEFLEKLDKDDFFILKDINSIPTNRFGEDERTVWLFKDQAEDYGTFLNDSGISEIYIHMNNGNCIDSRPRAFANQLWLDGLGDEYSDVFGNTQDLIDYSRVRGVKYETIKGDSQKNQGACTKKQFKEVMNLVENIVHELKALDEKYKDGFAVNQEALDKTHKEVEKKLIKLLKEHYTKFKK